MCTKEFLKVNIIKNLLTHLLTYCICFYEIFLLKVKLTINAPGVKVSVAVNGSAYNSEISQDDMLSLLKKAFSAYYNLFFEEM